MFVPVMAGNRLTQVEFGLNGLIGSISRSTSYRAPQTTSAGMSYIGLSGYNPALRPPKCFNESITCARMSSSPGPITRKSPA